MPATKTLAITGDSGLALYRDMTGQAAPAAFATSTSGSVFIADDSDKECIDAHTNGAYVNYSVGKFGKVYRFQYEVGGLVYTIDLLTNEIGSVQIAAV